MTVFSGPPGCEGGRKRKQFLLLTPKVRNVLWALLFRLSPFVSTRFTRISPAEGGQGASAWGVSSLPRRRVAQVKLRFALAC